MLAPVPKIALYPAFVLTLGLGYPMLGYLRRAGVTKQVSAEELPTHFSKTGTPTMGGVMFIAPIVVLTVLLALTWLHAGDLARHVPAVLQEPVHPLPEPLEVLEHPLVQHLRRDERHQTHQ